MGTQTITRNDNYVASGSSGGTWTTVFNIGNLTVTEETNSTSSLPIPSASVTAKFSASPRNVGVASITFWVATANSIQDDMCYVPFEFTTGDNWVSWSPNSTKSLTRKYSTEWQVRRPIEEMTPISGSSEMSSSLSEALSDTPIPGSDKAFFDSSNKSTKVINLYLLHSDNSYDTKAALHSLYNVSPYYNSNYEGTLFPSTSTTVIATLTLNAPPTFSTDNISYSTSSIYAGLTQATVTLSELDAKCDGDISSAVFKIGDQTAQRTDDGSLTIDLNVAGDFTPIVEVTDSRGQKTTKTFDSITVLPYEKPQVRISECERTTPLGIPGDEEESAVVAAIFSWTSSVTNLVEPTVIAENLNGTSVSIEKKWYKTRLSDGTLTDEILDWSSVGPNDMPIYALLDNSEHRAFNTQYSYQIFITPNDSYGAGATISQILGSAFYTVDFLAGGHGIAFGRAATKEGFYCGMDSYIHVDPLDDTTLYTLLYNLDPTLFDTDNMVSLKEILIKALTN